VPLPASGSKPDRTLRSAALKHGESQTRLSPPPPSPSADAGLGRVRLDRAARRRRVVSHASTCRRHGTSPVPVCSQSDFRSAAGSARHSAPPGLRSCCRPRPTRPPSPQRTDRSPKSPPAFFPLTPRGRRRDAVPSHPPLAAAPSRWLLPAAANGGLAAGAAVAAKASQMASTAGWGGRRAEPPRGRRATRRGERRAAPSACRRPTRRPPPDVRAGDQPDDLTLAGLPTRMAERETPRAARWQTRMPVGWWRGVDTVKPAAARLSACFGLSMLFPHRPHTTDIHLGSHLGGALRQHATFSPAAACLRHRWQPRRTAKPPKSVQNESR